MDPNQQNQQPNPQPQQPAPINSGQYDFINSAPPTKKKLFSFGGGLSNKLMIVAVALGVLTVVVFLFALIFGSGGNDTDTLLSVAKNQNQVIAVAEIGNDKAGGTKAQNLAQNVALTVTTDQKNIVNLLARSGKEVKAKEIALGISADVQKELTSAETNGRFDDVFINIMGEQLSSYQNSLKTNFNSLSTESGRQLISDANQNVELLIESIKR